MTWSASISRSEPVAAAGHRAGDGWRARLELGFACRDGRSLLVHRHQRGPLAVQRSFYPEGEVCHSYLLHPPGGVVGGDRLDIEVNVAEHAHALLTTPGATKLYRSAGPTALASQRLRIEAGGTLEWLPQENIYFVGSRVNSETRIDLEPGARHCGWEIHCLGRPALQERFESGRVSALLSIDRGGRPLLRDRLRVAGAQALDAAATLRGRPVVATLWATPADPGLLEAVRQLPLPPSLLAGATLLDDLMLVRAIAADTDAARRYLVDAWTCHRQLSLGRAPCAPRIWAT